MSPQYLEKLSGNLKGLAVELGIRTMRSRVPPQYHRLNYIVKGGLNYCRVLKGFFEGCDFERGPPNLEPVV